jgi:Spy/CpxP family protein refolding chaperone
MKRHLVIGALLLSSIGMSYHVQAETTAGQQKELPVKELGKDCPQQEKADIYQQLETMLKEVGLNDAQKVDIAAIIQAEKGRVASIQKKIQVTYNELMRAAFTAQYDQAKYKANVDKLSVLYKQVIVEHSQMMRDINAKLTNEQREKILKLIPKKRRPQHASGFGFGFGNFGF